MALTPLDIHNKEFSKAFRGYDEDEVNEFLDQIIKDMEILMKEKRDLEDKLVMMTERVNHFNSIEETLSKSILIAQETAEEVKNNARKEAQLIIKESEKNADRIINESLSRSRKIAIEIEELKKRASVYRMRFRSLLEAQLALLENGDWDEMEKIEEELARQD